MENKDRKLVFFDIDGTLIDGPTHQIPQSAVEAIRKLRENGHLAFINTGRTLVSIEPRIREIGFDGLVCGCGTHIYYEGETLFSHSILHEKCTEIVYELRRLGIPTFFEAEEHVYYDSRCMSPELGNSVSNFKSLNCSVPDMPERPEDSEVVFDKFFCLLRPDDPVDKLRSFIGDEFTAVPQGEHYLEIVPTAAARRRGSTFYRKNWESPRTTVMPLGTLKTIFRCWRLCPTALRWGSAPKRSFRIAATGPRRFWRTESRTR